MDGRIIASLGLIVLLLGSAGCLSTQKQDGAATATLAKGDAPTEYKPRKEGPKRNPLPGTEVAFGQLKESEADGEIAKKNPEIQAKWRDDARLAYQKAIKVDPNYLEAYRCLARLYGKMGDYDRAFDTYKQAMAKNAKDATLWYELGLCHNRRHEFDDSVRCFRKSLELRPENREVMKTLGFTLAHGMGKIEQGLPYLVQAQGAAMAHYNLAQIMLQRDRPDDAQRYLKIALRENPRYDQARELLRELEAPVTASAQP